jgi:hypothetical protein
LRVSWLVGPRLNKLIRKNLEHFSRHTELKNGTDSLELVERDGKNREERKKGRRKKKGKVFRNLLTRTTVWSSCVTPCLRSASGSV